MSDQQSAVVLQSRGLSKTYTQGKNRIEVLDNIDMSVHAGERVAIIGTSGAGKSTLLHILGGLDKASGGQVDIMGQSLTGLGNRARGRIRGKHLGFVYQFHHLLPEFTARENVAMPLLIQGVSSSEAGRTATEMLDRVGLAARVGHKPGELSGGERQRAAIARALVHRPAVVLADEPTGNLDEKTADKVFDMILELNQELNTALVIVTHDQRLAGRMGRTLELSSGKLHAHP